MGGWMAPFPLICVRFAPHISTFFPSTGLQADRQKSRHRSRTSDRSRPLCPCPLSFYFSLSAKDCTTSPLRAVVLVSLFLRQWKAGTGSDLTATAAPGVWQRESWFPIGYCCARHLSPPTLALTEAIPSAVCIPHPFIPVSPWPVELYPCATAACIPMAAGTLSRIPLLTKSHKILLGKSKVLYAPPRTYHIGLHWREALCHFACDFLLQKSQQVTHGGSPISPPPHWWEGKHRQNLCVQGCCWWERQFSSNKEG